MAPKDLTSSSITEGLLTSFIGQKVICYPRLPSTMDTARLEARRGIAEGTVIIAGEQTQGRGRMQRTWLSPSGNVALSIVLYPDIRSLPYLVMIASLAVARSIETVTDLKTQIKWPNDILINGKKVAGILIESGVKGDKVGYVLVGIGINVDLKTSDVAEISTTATSLKDESGKDDLRIKIIRSVLATFEKLYLQLPDGKAIYNEWRDKLETLGKSVEVNTGGNILKGIAESVDETGALTLRLNDGSLNKVVAGDVTLRHDD